MAVAKLFALHANSIIKIKIKHKMTNYESLNDNNKARLLSWFDNYISSMNKLRLSNTRDLLL